MDLLLLSLQLSLILYVAQCYTFETKYIEVPVDHFSFTNNATFKLRYLINNTYWKGSGPIFFYTGNEGQIETFAQNTGFIFDIAPEFEALIIFAEHRYYGKSLPFGNLSFTSPKYLGYLTSTQALEDFVLLIDELQMGCERKSGGTRPPVVAFGGSYGGMLSAWLRMKHPASVVGAIAASAPIWQFQVPCDNFNIITTNVYEVVNHRQDCSAPIKRVWKAVRKLGATIDGKKWLAATFKLCNASTLLKSNDLTKLNNWISDILVNMAMFNYPYETSFLAPLPARPVEKFCERLLEQRPTDDKSLIIALSHSLELFTNYTKTNKCNELESTTGNVEFTWNFQACTEMIMPMCSKGRDMFEEAMWNFTQYEDDCYKTYGVKQNMINLPILEYGGKDLNSASNIVFSNGLQDPWSSGGVMHNISDTVFAVVIVDAAHHLDLRAANSKDPWSVKKARNFHKNAIKVWIESYYHRNHQAFIIKD